LTPLLGRQPLRPTRLFGRERLFYETLVMSRSTPSTDAEVCVDGCLLRFVAQQLTGGFKVARLGLKDHPGAEVAKLVRRQHDTGAPL
jgi:hypothetical protein